jgi:hypothetical protein
MKELPARIVLTAKTQSSAVEIENLIWRKGEPPSFVIVGDLENCQKRQKKKFAAKPSFILEAHNSLRLQSETKSVSFGINSNY